MKSSFSLRGQGRLPAHRLGLGRRGGQGQGLPRLLAPGRAQGGRGRRQGRPLLRNFNVYQSGISFFSQ